MKLPDQYKYGLVQLEYLESGHALLHQFSDHTSSRLCRGLIGRQVDCIVGGLIENKAQLLLVAAGIQIERLLHYCQSGGLDMSIATAFKPEYIEHTRSDPDGLSTGLKLALDDTGCTDKLIDRKAHRILATALYGDYKILCWWASEQEDAISDGKPMLTVDKENATMLGICAFPRTGKSGDGDAIARLNARIKERVEHYCKAANPQA